MSQRVKVAFASCSRDHVPAFLKRFSEIAPEAELWVVSEFQPPHGRWFPYRVDRTASDNRRALVAALGSRTIEYVAISLQPRSPYSGMRRIALGFRPLRTLLYNENLDHFTLQPRSWPAVLRYLAWKTREQITFQTHPGGDLYTFLWRLKHPREFRRPLAYIAAKRAGRRIAKRKAALEPVKVPDLGPELRQGISIVIPSRNGRDLLAKLLPLLSEMLHGRTGEIIVVDNGSHDGTPEFLDDDHPTVRSSIHPEPLSFAKAVNTGIAMACYSHVLLLNNDMEPHESFLPALDQAFRDVPDLFCATAQIFFPEGRRREETGKAVMSARPAEHAFPIECALPLPGEDQSYVFYGSGGCSLYDTRKLTALGGFSEVFTPSYVEDLDIGFRGWQRGWPTVFAAASHVTHFHRTTTARYFTSDQLEQMVERNYLRFLKHSVSNPDLFARLWRSAIERLNWKAAIERHVPSLNALVEATESIPIEPAPQVDEERILAIGSGDIAVFPGRSQRSSSSTVILIATPYIPYPLSHGGAVRMYNLMRRAAPSVAQVLITFVDELHTPPSELIEICVEIIQVRRVGSHIKPDRGRPDVVEEFDTLAFRAALDLTLRKWQPDIAQLEFTQMACYATQCAPATTILVEHDITIDLYQQLLNEQHDPELEMQLDRWRQFESSAWRTLDCVVVMSEKDQGVITGARSVVTLHNGVDLERFQPTGREPDPGRLLFIGSFAHLPNLLAIDFFLREVWPRVASANVTLHIIAGANHEFHHQRFRDRISFPLALPNVLIEGFIPDVRPAYEKAALVIAPLLASAGTNIKIMEAMAMAKPIVSTTTGVNGLNLEPGKDVVIEDDPARMAQAIEALLRNPQARGDLGSHARRTAEQRFSWDAIAIEQQRMYDDLLKS